jgi:ATP-dependent Clp protease ATP-binding subunit ClpA
VYERFGEAAHAVVRLALEQSRHLGHGHVGTEHLLLGILAEGEHQASRRLLEAGATLAGCREMAVEAVGGRAVRDASARSDEPRYTERATRSLDRASRMALRRRDPEVDPTHILASLLDVEGRAGQVLRGLGIDIGSLRKSLDSVREPEAGDTPAPGAADVGDGQVTHPLCANCGNRLALSLRHELLDSLDSSKAGARFVVVYCGSCGASLGATPA